MKTGWEGIPSLKTGIEMIRERSATIESVLTAVGGRVVCGAGEYEDLAPAVPAVSPAWSPVVRFAGHCSKAQLSSIDR